MSDRGTVPLIVDLDRLEAASLDGRAFSNGTEWDMWSARWCGTCRHADEEAEVYCPLADLALISEQTPAEWGENSLNRRCTQYDPRDPERDARTA
jgi:hypothetical protein